MKACDRAQMLAELERSGRVETMPITMGRSDGQTRRGTATVLAITLGGQAPLDGPRRGRRSGRGLRPSRASIRGWRSAPFEIERFYERWEFRAELMLSSSDCESRALGELLALEPDAGERLQACAWATPRCRAPRSCAWRSPSLYERCGPEDVLALAAAEEGIFIAYHGLVGPGDHVVVEAPCYGSAVELARSTGAEVSLWQRRYENGWKHDLLELERLIGPRTRLIYINSPHNPTGTQMPRTTFERVIELAREREAVLFSDEVYRLLEHDPADRLPAVCDVYERGISLNTVSKSYGLPGLRIGWVVCRDHDLLDRMREIKLYTTICSSAPSELLVALALRHSEQIVERQPASDRREPAAAGGVPRPPRARPSSGSPRAPGRSASRGSRASPTSAPGVSGSPPRPVCCCFPAASTASRTTCGWASAAPRIAEAIERLECYLEVSG